MRRVLIFVFFISSAACAALQIIEVRLSPRAAYAAKDAQLLSELRGAISPDAPSFQNVRRGSNQQTPLEPSELALLFAQANTTRELLELYSRILVGSQLSPDRDGGRVLNELLAAELGKRQHQAIEHAVAEASRKLGVNAGSAVKDASTDDAFYPFWALVASFAIAVASGFSMLGIWFSAIFNRKNYLLAAEKDDAAVACEVA